MQAAMDLFQYPEFLAALLLAVTMLFSGRAEEQSLHWPGWLAQPAKSIVMLAPDHYVIWITRLLVQANWRNNLSLGDFASCKVYLTLACTLLLLLLPPYEVAPIMIAAWFLPDGLLYASMKRRQAEITRALPQALDLMVLCVDAGLGLDATLQRVAADNSGLPGALNDELKILGREILLGMDREKAYQELYTRTGVDELKILGSALNQANKLGLSIVKILRAQCEFIRKRHSQKAEEKAMKMPVYMAFPLWFFIMPSLMLLVLGPSLIRFYYQLHGVAGP